MVKPKPEMQRLAGKFAFLFTGVYLIILLSAVVTTASGEPIPLVGWPLLLLPAAAFVPSCIEGVRLHRTTDAALSGRDAVAESGHGGDRAGAGRRGCADSGKHRGAMTFEVDPAALRVAAAKIGDTCGSPRRRRAMCCSTVASAFTRQASSGTLPLATAT
ncbi:hypothetical protein AB0368_24015 [Actinoplanes sp. NPDC051475]|uniref:hypothetical protein n=1 Tax=Actinoplanes sp. NPDC051475 TaxID=3157225 RepID=UPI00344C67A8